MVPGAGLEPARCYQRGILNPLCLPISPPGHRAAFACEVLRNGGGTRSRTEVDGFAIRCMATLPFRHFIREFGASNEVRTRDLNLGKVALYQLSYTRILEGVCLSTRTHSTDSFERVNIKNECFELFA